MEGQDVAAMVFSLPQEQPETSGTGAGAGAGAGWGTCEELLLVSAVKRHGVNNWNLISAELKARAISLNVSPLYFSEVACKQKYDVLRGRYASSSSSSKSWNEGLGNDMHWFEELRKLRVAHLKRELEHYDGSIGTLQVKIKRLKAEKARDTSASKQLRKSIANFQLNDELQGGSSCEIAVQRSADKGLEVECKELHSAPVALESERNSEESTSSQAPPNLQQQVLREGEQWHAVEELPDAPPACIDVKATSVSVINDSPSLNSIKGGDDVEQDNGENSAMLSLAETHLGKTSAVLGSLTDDLQDVEADKVDPSNKDEHLVLAQSGYKLVDEPTDYLVTHEAGYVVPHGLDNDEVKAGNLDMQEGQQLPVNMGTVDDGLDIQVESEQNGMDRALIASADSIISMEVSGNDGSECAKTVTHSKGDFRVLPTLSSGQQLVSSGDVGNAGGRQAEANAVTEEKVKLSKYEEDIAELEKKQTLTDKEDYYPILEVGLNKQVHVALPLDLAEADPGVQLGRTILECPDDILTHAVPSVDDVLNSTTKNPFVLEGLHDSNQGVTSIIADEAMSCQLKQPIPEECNGKENRSIAHGVKEVETLGAERGGPGKGSPSPERHIVIALDGPGKTCPDSKIASTAPANAKDEDVCQMDSQTRLDKVYDIGSTGVKEEHQISAQFRRNVGTCEEKESEMAHETPANAVDLLKDIYGTSQENGSEFVSQAAEVVQCSVVETTIPMSPNSLYSKSKSMECRPNQAVKVDHDLETAEGTATENDKQLGNSERNPKRALVQISGNSVASDDMEVAENIGSVPDQDTHLISTEEVQVESSEKHDTSGKADLQISLGQSPELAKSASCVAEVEGRQSSGSCMEVEASPMPSLTYEPEGLVAKTDPELTVNIRQDAPDLQDARDGGECKLPEIIVDMKLEYSKEELSGVDSGVEPSSPLESLAGGLDSKMPSSHEGSDSVQDQYKDEGGDRNREERTQGNQDYLDSDVDKSEAGSPLDGTDEMFLFSRRNRKEPRVSGKLFPLLEVLRNLSNHKSAIHFKGRQEDPRYCSLIRRHLDLTIVRARLEEGVYSSSSEFFRDLLLIFNNAMVYYPRRSVEFEGAKALFTEATKEMNRIFQTEALLKQDRPATRTREVNKPKAFGGVATHAKVVAPSIGGGSAAKLVGSNSPLTSMPDSANRKRSSSRLGLVETPTNSYSEGGVARSASVNVLGGPSSSHAGEEDQENDQENDQEVNGRLKDRKKPRKGSGSGRGKPPREELLEGILLKNAVNKGVGRPKLRDVKEEETTTRRPAAPTKGGGGKTRAELESTRKREAEKEKIRGKEVRGKESDEIDDDDVLRKGKSLAKLRDQEVALDKGSDVKPVPKSRATTATRLVSNSHDIVAETVGRPSKGGRKPAASAKEPVRTSEQQAKKRMRK